MKSIIAACLLMAGSTFAFAQGNGDQVLLTVGGDKITLQEFENVYKKNPTANTDNKTLAEYMDLYVNFRLKVKEAKDLGMDTTSGFKSELLGYRKQLSQPYLTDTLITDKLLNEAYDRMGWHVRCSHILIKVAPDALPKDTLAAWNKIMKIRDRVVKNKEGFAKVAEQTSEDPYVKGTGGDLGYFTALVGYVYPFESGAYNTKVGEVSMPVRTQFGYHLIWVTDKVKHMDIQTAHIMIKLTKTMTKEDSANAKQKIDEIYQKLKAGADFVDACKTFSEDKGTSPKGGELPLMNMSSNFPPEFKTTTAKLKDGEFSEPFMTRFGWHIVKRISSKPLAPFADLKGDLKAKIAKDMRSNMSRQSLIGKIKGWYGFKEMTANLNEVTKSMDSSIFKGKWVAGKSASLAKPLFTLDGKNFTQGDFVKYVESHQTARTPVPYSQLMNGMYKAWVEETLVAYEESKLDAKYPRFRALMDEYRDGILLFDLTDKKVWSKAVKDTAGLKAYYEQNKTKFMWDERADATIYTCADEKTAAIVRKMVNKGKSDKEILDVVNKSSQLNLTVDSRVFNKGENATIDKNWKPGLTTNVKENNKVVFVNVKKIMPPTPKAFNESKGLVTAEYQTYLENEWLKELKAKYPVTINQDLLKTIK